DPYLEQRADNRFVVRVEFEEVDDRGRVEADGGAARNVVEQTHNSSSPRSLLTYSCASIPSQISLPRPRASAQLIGCFSEARKTTTTSTGPGGMLVGRVMVILRSSPTTAYRRNVSMT